MLGAAFDFKADQADAFIAAGNFIINQGDDILVEHFLLDVGKILEALEKFIQGIVAQFVAKFLNLLGKGMAAGMLAQHQCRFGQTNRFRGHDLVGLGVLQHAVLMDAAFMCKGIRPDNRLVGLYIEAGNRRQQARGPHDFGGLDVGLMRQNVGACPQRHDDFFHRRIAGPFADTVDGAFYLARTGADSCQRIGHGQAQIVMAVNRDDCLVDIRHAVHQHVDEGREFRGNGIADCIGNVDCTGAVGDRCLDAAAEKIVIGAAAIFRRPFDIVGKVAGMGDTGGHSIMHRVRFHPQLELHMQRTG